MSEFSKSNFQRIYFINLLLGIPLIVLFAWPYYYAAKLIGLMEALRYLGAFLFSLPFMMTILHGHVTMALGSVHRDHYYQWLTGNHYTYGLLFLGIHDQYPFPVNLAGCQPYLSTCWVFVEFLIIKKRWILLWVLSCQNVKFRNLHYSVVIHHKPVGSLHATILLV